MLKNAIYDITELGKDKISKDRHQKQTHMMTTPRSTSRVNPLVK